MYPPNDLRSERSVHRAVSLYPVHRPESVRTDRDLPVAFATVLITGVAAMGLAYIENFKRMRSELILQAHPYFIT